MTWDAIASIGAVAFWSGLAFTIYVYVGYPALLALALLRRGRRRGQKPPEEDPSLPTVTVLVSAHNEAAVLARKLASVLRQDYPPDRMQVIVAEDGSTDDTVEIAKGFEDRGVLVLSDPVRSGKSAAIDRAMRRATGDVVVLTDADNVFAEDAVRNLVRPFANPQVGLVGGARIFAEGDGELGASTSLYWRYESWIKRAESELSSTVAVVGEMLALRRSLYRPIPPNTINDDFWLALDVLARGYRVLYEPSARAFERVSASLDDELTRRTRIVAGRFQALAGAGSLLRSGRPEIVWFLVSHKILRPLVPLAMIAMAAGNLLWVVRGGLTASVALAVQAFVYGVAAFVGDARGVARLGPLGKALYAISFLVRSNLASFRGMIRAATGRQSNLWTRVARRND